jgi:hypothetical protein
MATASLVAGLLASWNDLGEMVDVEIKDEPQTSHWTKLRIKEHFQLDRTPPICCHYLPAPCIPGDIITIYESRDNEEEDLQHYSSNDQLWRPQRRLLQGDFRSVVRFSPHEQYFLVEEGEVTVMFNGRPLTAEQRLQADQEPGLLDMKDLQPTAMPMKKGVVTILPPYTAYSFSAKKDSLVTAGNIVPKGMVKSESHGE